MYLASSKINNRLQRTPATSLASLTEFLHYKDKSRSILLFSRLSDYAFIVDQSEKNEIVSESTVRLDDVLSLTGLFMDYF